MTLDVIEWLKTILYVIRSHLRSFRIIIFMTDTTYLSLCNGQIIPTDSWYPDYSGTHSSSPLWYIQMRADAMVHLKYWFRISSILERTKNSTDRYASLALIETIRLYLSFLSGNSVNLFCLRFTLQIASSGTVWICRSTCKDSMLELVVLLWKK